MILAVLSVPAGWLWLLELTEVRRPLGKGSCLPVTLSSGPGQLVADVCPAAIILPGRFLRTLINSSTENTLGLISSMLSYSVRRFKSYFPNHKAKIRSFNMVTSLDNTLLLLWQIPGLLFQPLVSALYLKTVLILFYLPVKFPFIHCLCFSYHFLCSQLHYAIVPILLCI